MAPRTLPLHSRNFEAVEDAARAEVNLRAGRTLTDSEWEQVRARLLAFVKILRGWKQKAEPLESKLGKVA